MEKPDFSGAPYLEPYFAEIDDDLENLHGLFQGERARMDALEKALLSLLGALDDKMPTLRTMVAQDLEESAAKAANPLGSLEPDEFDIEALTSLASKILTDRALVKR